MQQYARLLYTSLALLALIACGGSQPSSTQGPSSGSATPPSSTPAQPPPPAVDVPEGDFALLGDPRAVRGGTFVQETNSFPTHLNLYGPEREANIPYHYAEAMFNTLISVHPNTLEYVPELAESWEMSEDLKTIVFHLDPDAVWSDGTPITAQDVAFTIELIRHPKVNEVLYKVDLDAKFPDPPEVIDDRTIKFVGAKSSWRNLLFFDDIYIYPAHAVNPDTYLDDWRFAAPVVSGAYRLGKYETGKYISLDRRDDFWGEGKRPFVGTYNFDTVMEKVILEDAITFENMKKGEIDFYLVTEARRWHEECDFDKVQKGWIQKQRIAYREPNVPSQMAFNMEHPMFNDVRVREGLFWLFDREQLHDQLFFHEYVNKNSCYANSIYENPDNPKITFDPRKGLTRLKEAGWSEKDSDGILTKDGQRLEFTFLYIHPSAERVYTLIQETYRKYGVKMNLKLIAPSAWVKVLDEKDFELVYANWAPDPFPKPRDMWHSEMADRDQSFNICRFRNEEVDRIIEDYETEPDLAKRAELIREMDGIICSQFPYLLDWYSDNLRLLWWDKFGMPEWAIYATKDPRMLNWKLWWYDEARAERLKQAMASGQSVPQAPAENTYWRDHDA